MSFELAFSSMNKDIFINGASIMLKHENNESHILHWTEFGETLLSMEMEGQTIPYERRQRAIALNITQDTVVDKEVIYADQDFWERGLQLESDFEEFLSNQMSVDLDKVFSSKEFNQLNNLYKDRFFWKAGKYELHFTFTTNRDINFEYQYTFNLTSRDVRKLEQNIPSAQQSLKAEYFDEFESPTEWDTVYVHLKEMSNDSL